MTSLEDRLHELVDSVISGKNIELVDLEIKGKPGNQTVRVYVDRPGGITLDECEQVSRVLSDELDMVDLIPGKYRLEVSSPGISRPLTRPSDFSRNVHREVRVTYEDAQGLVRFSGKIESVSETCVQIRGKSEIREIPFVAIKKAKLSLPW